jgi:hypothetical protein
LSDLHGFATPRQDAHAGDELLRLKRLDEVVVCAQLKGSQFLTELVLGGNDNDRNIAELGIAAEALEDLESVRIWQLQIHDQHLRGKGWDLRQSFGARLCIF